MLFITAFGGRLIAVKFFKNEVLLNLTFYFIFLKLFLHYLIPSILRISSDYQFEREDNVQLLDLLFVYIIEFFSWLFWSVGFLFTGYIMKENNEKIERKKFIHMNISESKFFFFVLSIGFIINMYYLVSLQPVSIIFSIFSQLFFFAGISVGPLLLVASRKVYNNYFFILGIIVSAVSILGIATRGAIVYTFFYLAFLLFFVFTVKNIFKYIIVSLIILITLKISVPDFLGGRISINENGIALVPQDFSEKQGNRSLTDEIEWRLGAPTRAGTAFLYLYKEKPAGINPIKNSFLGFLPRSLNENKPHPSALKGNDQFSLGMYLIMGRLYGTESLMVEFPTGAHFYWEFGIFGVVFLSIISGIYIGFCLKILSNKGLLAIPLLFATFKPFGYVDPKIWVSDIVMQFYQLFLPCLFIFIAIRILLLIRNSLKNI
jgi:hypothetical protein